MTDAGNRGAWVTALPAKVCVNELVVTPVWNRMYIDKGAL